MTRSWAFIFPGQGAQSVGMGRALAEAHPAAMAAWDQADKALGIPVKQTAWEGPEEALTRTDMAQPALLAAGVAALRVLEGAGIFPRATAGHSLGEYGALVASAGLKYSDALHLVRVRGEAMQAAAESAGGGMAAVLGADLNDLTRLCAEIGGVAPANINAPGQVVVSGTDAGIAALEARAREIKARRVVRLNVAGPFHSPAMAPAAQAVAEAMQTMVVENPLSPMYANVTASQAMTAEDVRQNLVAQITGQVRWSETIQNMIEEGFTRFVEVGPGNVLAGLVRRIAPEAEVFSVGDPESLAAFLEAVNG